MHSNTTRRTFVKGLAAGGLLTDEDAVGLMKTLKKQSDYYNYNKPTVGDFIHDVSEKGWGSTVADRKMWTEMKMNSTDLTDVSGATYTYLMNGQAPDSNWTGVFRPGEKIRLRFINGSAMTYFDVRIPGLKMTVVAADGLYVKPVSIDEFRIAVAETFDVIVEPTVDGVGHHRIVDQRHPNPLAVLRRSGSASERPRKRKRRVHGAQTHDRHAARLTTQLSGDR